MAIYQSKFTGEQIDDAIASTLFEKDTPTTITVGGIQAGTSFSTPITISQLFEQLLYPYVPLVFNGISLTESAGAYEYGTPITISKVIPNFTLGSNNIKFIKIGTNSGKDDLHSGESATSGTAISLVSPKIYDGTLGGDIYCTISDGVTTDEKKATVSYTYYTYTAVTSTTTIPTTADSANNNGISAEATITTTDNTYIWFLRPYRDKTQIQQYSMNQWNNMSTTYAGKVTFTTSTGYHIDYHAYRTDKMMSATEKYRIN